MFKKGFACQVVTAIAVTVAATGGPAAASAQSTFRGSPDHAGVFEAKGPRNLKTLKWRFKTGGKVRSSPVVAGAAVYVGSEDGYLYALDMATGTLRWKAQTGGDLSSSPAVAGGRVFVTGGDGRVYAFAADTGRVHWIFETGPALPYALFGTDPRTHDYWASSPVVADGVLYVGSADGHLYALDASTGRLRWKRATGAAVRSSPAVAGDRVYVGSMNGSLWSMDASNGEPVWTFKTQGNPYFPAGEIQSSPALVSGTVFVGARDGVVYAVDRATGRERWVSDQEMAWVNGSPAVTNSLVIVGVSDGEAVVALDARTGAARWRFKTNGRVFSSPAVADGLVYVGNSYGIVYVLEAETGRLRDQAYAEAGVHSSPVVAGGTVIVGSDDSCVYAFEERADTPRIATPVPDSVLAECEGAYRFSPQITFTVRARGNGRISVQIGARPAFEVVAAGEREFFHEKADLQVRFVRNEAGRVREMVFTQSGVEARLARLE